MIDINRYFDWAATSPVDKELLQKAVDITSENWANPSSTHKAGKDARLILEEARKRCADVLKVKPETIYFTSGGTESDQIPLLSLLAKPSKGTVLISSIEHPAVKEQAQSLIKCGWKVISLPSDEYGIISAKTVEQNLTPDTMLVCIMAVNNETGIIQPIYEIADTIIKCSQGKRKPKLHIDCVQAAGKIPLDLSHEGIDSAALSSHKICGPRGTGILYLKDKIEPFLKGGGQENGIRSGTENVLGALAFSYCLEKYYMNGKIEDVFTSADKNKQYMDYYKRCSSFLEKLSSIKDCTIIPAGRMSKNECFSPFVVQAAFKNIPGNVLLRALDAKGFYISTGSACSSKKNSRPVLEAMHVEPHLQETSVRFSFGPATTDKALEELVTAVKEINSQFNK